MAKMKKNTPERFTALSNTIVRDDRLSWKARGIFLYLFSQSDDWDFYETEVANHATDGRNSLRSGLKELEEKGYIQRERIRNEKGQLMSSNWLLSDKPMSQKLMLQKPMYDYRTLDSSTLSNTNLSNTNLSNTNNKKTPPVLNANTSIVSADNEKKEVAVTKQALQSNTEVTSSNDSKSKSKSKNIDIELENTTTEKKAVANSQSENIYVYQKVLRYYEESGYGLASPIITQKMNYELQDFVNAGSTFEQSADIICKAMEIGAMNNAKTFSYVLKITKGWLDHNLTTLEQVNAHINRPKFSNSNYGRAEKVEPQLDKQPQPEEFKMTKEERERWIRDNI